MGIVEQVEELYPDLSAISFPDFPELAHRKIHVFISWSREEPVARIAQRSVSGRSQDAAVRFVATTIKQRRNGEFRISASWGIRCLGIGEAVGIGQGGTPFQFNGSSRVMREGVVRPNIVPVLISAAANPAVKYLAGSEPVSCFAIGHGKK